MASSPSDDALYEKDDAPLSPMTEETGPVEIEGETPEEKEKRIQGMKEELEKVESEITMLRQVLGSKVRHATELKRQLGITPFQEFKNDLQSGLNTIKSSDSYQNANDTLQTFNEKLYSTQAYQKTSTIMKSAGEKTSSAFSTVGQTFSKKMGDIKNSQTFKSLDERVHTTYNTVKKVSTGALAKVTGSRSTQDIDEAFREAQIADDGSEENSTADVAPVDEKVPL